jgi:hypothetical protein
MVAVSSGDDDPMKAEVGPSATLGMLCGCVVLAP